MYLKRGFNVFIEHLRESHKKNTQQNTNTIQRCYNSLDNSKALHETHI